ncbi:hypothetical protein D0809_21945 [Flavobacterium circumlabens]|uniref:Uncharacterized protein n=1 Tax=Flavobacterium circumlabens TaxID=2133765 RepID=A0A4Y7U713_9FLAO|nr:hypothetical protein EV142_101956 [Flavobacterium circumlabens]TEB42237.1 hypothetical protein D0809_21945 [Flavobacterium circumlabens]
MKTQSTISKQNSFNFIFIILTSAGFGYAFVNQFLLNKPNLGFLVQMAFLCIASFASWQRNKKRN